MNRCDKCNVSIIGNFSKCPLCKNKIIKNIKSENIFPKIKTVYESYEKVFNYLLLATIITAICTLITNLIFTPNKYWFIFVYLGLASSWAITYLAINRRANLVKQIFIQSILLTILVILWDVTTGWHSWSIDYVLPAIYAVGIITSFVVGTIIKIKIYDVIFYLILDIILGFIPLIFLITKLLSNNIASVICVLISQTALVTLIIFEGKNILGELKRRLHI